MPITFLVLAGVGKAQPNSAREVVNNPRDVMLVQKCLNLARIIIGMVDGKCGDKIINGIQKFQRKNNLVSDGRVLSGSQTDIQLADYLAIRSSVAIFNVPGLVENSRILTGVETGVRSDLKEKVALFAKDFGAISINSGRRSLKRQAELMADFSKKQLERMYPGAPYVKEIEGLTAGVSGVVRKSDGVYNILQKHYRDGPNPKPYISRHLQGLAVDISAKNWSPSDRWRAEAIARKFGLKPKDETNLGIKCFHVAVEP